MVKAGVQWGLFGGALQLLGNKRQHDAYLRDVMSFDLPGCFAMTETGHGSDVQQLRTTCTYDPATQTFDLHTPHQAARKDYIGNAAKDGRMAVVFAQLITQGRNHGVHAWLVPIRNEDGTPCPGVTIGDDGPKAGLNGVDNGRLTFDHVRVPARHAARPLRPGRRGRHLHERDRERDPPLLHHARHARARPGQRRRLGLVGDQARPRHRRPLRQRPAPVRRPRRGPRDRHQRLPRPPAQAAAGAGHDLRAALRAGRSSSRRCTTSRPRCTCTARTSTRRRSASWSRGPPGSRWPRPGTPPARSSCAARRAAVRATCRRTGCRTSRPTPTSSPPSRATTPSCCSWWPRACSPATATPSARSRAGAGSASSPTWSARPCWSGRRPAR